MGKIKLAQDFFSSNYSFYNFFPLVMALPRYAAPSLRREPSFLWDGKMYLLYPFTYGDYIIVFLHNHLYISFLSHFKKKITKVYSFFIIYLYIYIYIKREIFYFPIPNLISMLYFILARLF